jgi:hypothetical protein
MGMPVCRSPADLSILRDIVLLAPTGGREAHHDLRFDALAARSSIFRPERSLGLLRAGVARTIHERRPAS